MLCENFRAQLRPDVIPDTASVNVGKSNSVGFMFSTTHIAKHDNK